MRKGKEKKDLHTGIPTTVVATWYGKIIYLSVANRYRFMREVGTDECTQGNSTWRCYSLVSLKIELRSIHCATLTCGKPWWDMMNFCLSNTGM